jgi:benzoyl-CoA reductase subunit C
VSDAASRLGAMPQRLAAIIERSEELSYDLDFARVKQWKSDHAGRAAIGFLPVWVPREVIHAAGGLPVAILGGGDRLEIIRGDACFQSYICHLPRSVTELGMTGRLDLLDGMLFPSICDVIRNLSGIWKLLFPQKLVRYLDLPQNFDPEIGGAFFRRELETLYADVSKLCGTRPDAGALRASIAVYNENRALHRELDALRRKEPWRVPTSEAYLVVRAGSVLPVEEHNELLRAYLDLARSVPRAPLDNARVVLTGAFCEQPPLDLIKTLERTGCYIVDDDFLLAPRFLTRDVAVDGDPLENLALAFLDHAMAHASVLCKAGTKGDELVERVRDCQAEGVLFAAPSFCDPALLDQPMVQATLDRARIPHTSFKYCENTGQFQGIREQAGTFADAIKLWSEA